MEESWIDGLCRRLGASWNTPKKEYVLEIPLGLEMYNQVKNDPSHFLHKYLIDSENNKSCK
jgi:hypothetical protein